VCPCIMGANISLCLFARPLGGGKGTTGGRHTKTRRMVGQWTHYQPGPPRVGRQKQKEVLYCSKKVLTSRISSPDKYQQVVLGVCRGVYGPMVNCCEDCRAFSDQWRYYEIDYRWSSTNM
jgi:hypothetical protein